MLNKIRKGTTLAIIPWLLLLSSLSVGTRGQTPPSRPSQAKPAPKPSPSPSKEPGEVDVIRVTSNLVVVPVSATDAKGDPVRGLKREDFSLEEEGRTQEIAEIGDPEQVPLDIVILFDVSSSVSKSYTFQQQTAAGFLKEVLKPEDRAAIFAIRDKPQLEQGFASAQIAAAKLLAIPAATSPTPTAFYDAVTRAAQYLTENAPGRHRRVILVISDGEDNFSDRIQAATLADVKSGGTSKKARQNLDALHRKVLLDVQRDVQRADAVFYSINPSGAGLRLNVISARAQGGMQQLADATGGSSFVPEKSEDLEAVFMRIAAELRAQYLLQYYSKSEVPNGAYLRIKVQTPNRSELRVRARQGYYVSER